LRMERVTLLEGPAQARSQFPRDHRLARSRHAHDHQDRRTAPVRAGAVETMDTGRIGDEDRIGPADEQAALDHPDDASNALLEPRRIGDGAEAAVENSVAAIGDEGLARRRLA